LEPRGLFVLDDGWDAMSSESESVRVGRNRSSSVEEHRACPLLVGLNIGPGMTSRTARSWRHCDVMEANVIR